MNKGAEEKIDIFMSRVIPESSSNYLLYLEIPPDDENKPKVRLINRRGKLNIVLMNSFQDRTIVLTSGF